MACVETGGAVVYHAPLGLGSRSMSDVDDRNPNLHFRTVTRPAQREDQQVWYDWSTEGARALVGVRMRSYANPGVIHYDLYDRSHN